MEIGSYIELDLRDSGEYHSPYVEIARLNSARSGIFHALSVLQCKSIQIPHYLCPSVKKFLVSKGINVKEYFISESMEPENIFLDKSEAILIVNYFGIFSTEKLFSIASRYVNVIIDNCQSFFSEPIDKVICIYSPRKFLGVPDGGYVLGPNAQSGASEYEPDHSSDTAAFLLKRIEKGSSAAYKERMLNEKRIDKSDVRQMSALTKKLLANIDYDYVITRRKKNFHQACQLYSGINLIQPENFIDQKCVPMVYPLVVENINLVDELNIKKIYTGRWWNSVVQKLPPQKYEVFLSKYMVPIPIDQRYDSDTINYCHSEVMRCLTQNR
jgi:hypothetical protein